MLERKTKPIAVAVGAVFAAALATASLADSDSALFAAEELDRGYDRLVDTHGEDGSCGEEGSCGEKDEAEGTCGEGKCGEGDESDDA